MKKYVAFLMVICLCLSLCACGKEQVSVSTPHIFGNGLWYHIYEDQTSLQVLLEANPTTGYLWSYDISDPELLEATFFDYAPDESDGNTGVGGVYGGSFAPTGKGSGTVTVTFRHMRPWDTEPIETRVLSVAIDSGGLMSVKDAEIR